MMLMMKVRQYLIRYKRAIEKMNCQSKTHQLINNITSNNNEEPSPECSGCQYALDRSPHIGEVGVLGHLGQGDCPEDLAPGGWKYRVGSAWLLDQNIKTRCLDSVQEQVQTFKALSSQPMTYDAVFRISLSTFRRLRESSQ